MKKKINKKLLDYVKVLFINIESGFFFIFYN